jgi:hypothetical protein
VDEPSFSFGPSGAIRVNAAASRVLLSAGIKAVLLLWDKSLRKVAVKAAPKVNKNAYAVSFSGAHSCTIRAKAFLGFIGWDAPDRRTLPANWNEKEKMFEITLPRSAKDAKSGGAFPKAF